MANKKDKIIMTYSAIQMAKECARKYFWRYIKQLVPLRTKAPALRFGHVIHELLHSYYLGSDWKNKLEQLKTTSETQNVEFWIKAQEMISAYVAHYYGKEDFEVLALESQFAGHIRKPVTYQQSRTYIMAGKIDGIVKRDAGEYLLEHKTATNPGKDYLDQLWTDLQIILYSVYTERQRKTKLQGVLYNILHKPTIRWSQKDTEESFRARVRGWYENTPRFDRIELTFSRDDYERVKEDIWNMTQYLIWCNRTQIYTQNTKSCFTMYGTCQYYPLCQSNNNLLVELNQYTPKEAHAELDTEEICSQLKKQK